MAGCDGTLGLDANANGSLAFAVDRVNSGLLGLSSSPPNEVSSGSHTIVLTSATMTASELELKGVSSGSAGSGSGTTSEFEAGSVTVSLPVEGGTSREITAPIGAGTYDRFEMKVRTMRLTGTYDGEPFDVTTTVNDELEMRMVPPLVVADGAASTAVTVALDLQSWFRSTAGGLLDPRNIRSDTTVAAMFRANVHNSFEATEDHDGHHGDGSDDD
jgi:hypothetical protein